MQKLRGLVSQQMTMMGTWLQTEQSDKDLAQVRRDRFFNAEDFRVTDISPRNFQGRFRSHSLLGGLTYNFGTPTPPPPATT